MEPTCLPKNRRAESACKIHNLGVVVRLLQQVQCAPGCLLLLLIFSANSDNKLSWVKVTILLGRYAVGKEEKKPESWIAESEQRRE